ncbi:DeoR/GlpR family DNA-binding transcription regulator [Methylobacterium platani]|uniref:DeoR family transcriptional regulator n=2 Tax=Methylobacterium platani TaxID=427683 RepID=A0A179SIJ4_9HYPH|nr:DeoR/GlpR family DNA-binding transcription regulator [Methylobacterium platani]KMO10340.1 DeoR faimly transcriptional regulator [Methylobacterium platani JCM 14648]OAS26403.1 DeoR family transcriptional regulator [Methylobacterium platani]
MTRGRHRHPLLLEALQAGEVVVEELAERFGVSASTIRRDLQQLASEKTIRRTYGGAVIAHPLPETSLPEREAQARPEKAAIARAAIGLLSDDDILVLDGGSTVATFGAGLIGGAGRPGRRHAIITNNLPLVGVLAGAPGLALTVLGGAVRPGSMSTMGPLAEASLRRLTADKAVVSGDGFVAGRGLCEAAIEQVSLKSLMMEQAAEVVVLMDSSKLGRATQGAWAPLPRRWTLVTDAGATQAQCAEAEEAGARVVRAGS